MGTTDTFVTNDQFGEPLLPFVKSSTILHQSLTFFDSTPFVPYVDPSNVFVMDSVGAFMVVFVMTNCV